MFAPARMMFQVAVAAISLASAAGLANDGKSKVDKNLKPESANVRTNTDQGRDLLEQARQSLQKMKFAKTPADREKLRDQAQPLLIAARRHFQAAHDQKLAAFKKFPIFIPRDEDDQEEYLARKKAETSYITAQLDLAFCTFREAELLPRDSQEFHQQMTLAAASFQSIHQKYRSLVAGLFAHLWQGKCYEEQNDIRKALGIYNEMLSHPGTSRTLVQIKNQALQFRLECLNSEQRKDYILVIHEAGAWLGSHEDKHNASVGFAVRLQKAYAHSKLAEKLSANYKRAKQLAVANRQSLPPKPVEEIATHLRFALAEFQSIHSSPEPHPTVSDSTIESIGALLRKMESELPPATAEKPNGF